MYELTQVAGNSYYIQSPAKIGLVRLNDTDVCLIDSGNDKEAGRKVRQILDANGWHLTTIYNTHSNADHIGGNQYLQNQTGCKIYAPGIECDFTRHPVLEPSFLYGGYPPKELQHKFLMAKALTARAFVPAHAAATEDIAPLAQYNIDKVLEIADIITELCRAPQTFEAVLQQLFRRFDLVMDFEQYVLVGSTVRSYLAWLKDSGKLRAVFDDNCLLWQRA